MKTFLDMLNIALGQILPETMKHSLFVLQFYGILLSTLWNVVKLQLCPLLFSELCNQGVHKEETDGFIRIKYFFEHMLDIKETRAMKLKWIMDKAQVVESGKMSLIAAPPRAPVGL